jgi:lysozyme
MKTSDYVYIALTVGLLYWAIRNRDAIAQSLVDIAGPEESSVTGPTYTEENPNLPAFLATIRWAEGTSGPDGYRMLFGGQLFDSFSDHPRIPITRLSNGRPLTSTAAGAYQMLSRTWDSVRSAIGAPDFSPAWQDQGAIELLRRRGALDYVLAGDIASAVNAARKEWASLPGAGYGQPEKALRDLVSVYTQSGGAVSTA